MSVRPAPHICFVLTVPFVLNAFVAPTIRVLLERGWRVTVLVNARDSLVAEDIQARAEVIQLDIARAISPFQDVRTIWTLIWLFRSRRFDIVHSITPKAGLLTMLAARMAGIKIRVHTFTGQVWATQRGISRWLLKSVDRLMAQSATSLLVDSGSQRDFLVAEKVVMRSRLTLLGHGSVAGVNTSQFSPNGTWRKEIRAQLGVPSDAVLLTYLGRMHIEKGVVELAKSFLQIAAKHEQAHLLLVGPDEGALQPALKILSACRNRVHVLGLSMEPEKYLAASDIFCLASFREGFGLSLIEAASAGLPSVASRIYGVTDAVIDGVTGLLVPVCDTNAFSEAAGKLLTSVELRNHMGAVARQRAELYFSQKTVVDAWIDFYVQQLSSA